jgi:hypothetical protein
MTIFFVMIENGRPVGVARQDRESAAREWERQAAGRELVIVEECR